MAGRRISALWSAPATLRPTSPTRRRSTSPWNNSVTQPISPVWYLGDTALDMQAARAAGVTAVLIGDAGHDQGIAHAAPDLHFPPPTTWPHIFVRLREGGALLDWIACPAGRATTCRQRHEQHQQQ